MIFTLSIMILGGLWVYSVFSFALWRYRILTEKHSFSGILRDYLFQVYLKVSGISVLAFFFLLVKSP